MTSKDALENFILIKHCMNCMHCNFLEDCDDLEKPCDKWRRIIEQDLDKLEELKKENLYLQAQNKTLSEMIQIDKQIETHTFELIKENIKIKKVIKILKSKTIVLAALKLSKDLNDYNRMIFFEPLIQEEYELLKEYLTNEY